MKKWRILLICLLGALQLTAFATPKGDAPKEKKKKEKKVKVDKPRRVYLCGVAMGFNDSTVYLTDIQYLDSVIINSEGALSNHANYTMQMKVYLEGTLGELHQTCAVIYSAKKRRVENELSKMRYRYESSKDKTLKRISKEDFSFQRY